MGWRASYRQSIRMILPLGPVIQPLPFGAKPTLQILRSSRRVQTRPKSLVQAAPLGPTATTRPAFPETEAAPYIGPGKGGLPTSCHDSPPSEVTATLSVNSLGRLRSPPRAIPFRVSVKTREVIPAEGVL